VGGGGGDAIAEAHAISHGDGHAVRINPSAPTEKGAIGGEAAFSSPRGGPGGHATSVSRGEARGNSEVLVNDSAIGGSGSFEFDGGDASSTAIASGAGTSQVSAFARAFGGSADARAGMPSNGTSSALATATGLGVVEARALATSWVNTGLQNNTRDARALATGTGPVSHVETHAASATGANAHVNAISRIASDAFIPNFTAYGFSESAVQGMAFGLASPSDSLVDQRLGTGSSVEAQLGAGSDALVLGVLGVSFATPAFDADVDMRLATPSPEGLLLGLANPQALGAGFQSLVFTIEIGGVLFLEQSFASAAQALAFFGDELIPIAMGDALDLEIGMRTTGTASADRFKFDFVLMTVPEPGSGALVLVGLVWVARARRAKARL
jgi:hypothetical protein